MASLVEMMHDVQELVDNKFFGMPPETQKRYDEMMDARQRERGLSPSVVINPNDYTLTMGDNIISTSSTTWGGGWVTVGGGGEPSQKDKMFAAEELKELSAKAQPIAVKEKRVVDEKANRLKELGFSGLSNLVADIAEKAMKENLIGARGYTKITEAMIVKAKRNIENKSGFSLTLSVTPVSRYMGQHYREGEMLDSASLPPTEVLDKMAAAKKEGLFDEFAIIHVAKAPDPILVGRLNGSGDLYFVAEWGDDISLAELVA